MADPTIIDPDRLEAFGDELADPMRCTTPAYGAPGVEHCAACCYGTGYVITGVEDKAVLEAAKALWYAARVIRHTTSQQQAAG